MSDFPHNAAPANAAFTDRPRLCWPCLAALALLLAAIFGSFAYLAIDVSELLSEESRANMLRFVVSFFPPDTSAAFIAKIGRAALETLAVSTVASLLAALCGLLLALPASGRYGLVAKGVARSALNVLRSIPELVWAALMVMAAGLGPFAGTLALALHTAGVLGRLFAEALENASPLPARALVEAGSTARMAFVYGTLPVIAPQLLAYTLYRWEMNIRMAAVLGFVGAGGLGGLLYFHLALRQNPQSLSVLIGMLILVIGVDAASGVLRRRMVSGR